MTLPEPNDSFRWVQVAAGPALVCRPLEAFARHFFATRAWRLGSASSEGSTEPDSGWGEVERAMEIAPSRLVRVHQVHGRTVLVHRADQSAPAARPEADIIVSDSATAALAVQTADCVPLLIADRRKGVVAAAHAGWRGLAANVPAATLEALAREFGSRPADLIAAAGPAIGACCYEVGEEVRERFGAGGFSPSDIDRWFHEHPRPTASNPSMPRLSSTRRPRHWYFDAWRATRDALETAGVQPDRIHVADLCTASHDILCSYRRDGEGAGRMAGAISCVPLRP